ncbi:MAG: ATP-binding protein [Lachnospiraceae bacterium]|nr:ATP-binding protein [Lachnospiraceae bacterium]
MPLTNAQYDAIMREYDARRNIDRRAAEERRAEIYKKYPRLAEIDEELGELSLSRAEQLLYEEKKPWDPARQDLLHKEKEAILEKEGVKDEDFTPSWFCPDCKDTGIVDGKKCHCFKQAEIDLIYRQSNLKRVLEKENFSAFRLDYYSEEPINDQGLIPREVAKAAENTCREFVESFGREFKNLLFYGDTGVGKTFLSNCIAKELLDRGHSVIYFTAPRLFDIFEKDVFRKNSYGEDGAGVNGYDPENRGNIYEASLLIIDDLGTELINSFTVSQLTACLNERLLREKPTIISTNLQLRQLPELYSMRVFSRLNYYTFIRLVGDDIRFKKQMYAED